MHMDCRHNGYEISGKACANRLNPLVIIKEQKEKNLYHISAHFGIKVSEGHYIWYQSKVKTLGPDGLIDMQVCCELYFIL